MATNAKLDSIIHHGDSYCPLCRAPLESLEHCIMFCPFARSVWFASPFSPFLFTCNPNLLLIDWITSWFSPPIGWHSDLGDWAALCATTSWFIWKARCKKVFDNVTPSPIHTSRSIRAYLSVYSLPMPTSAPNQSTPSTDPLGSRIWLPPRPGSIKINFDASFINYNEICGIGLVMRDSFGMCRMVKLLQCRAHSAEEAEALAALEAVKWANEHHLTDIIFEGDALPIIGSITSSTSTGRVGWRTRAHLQDIQLFTPSFSNFSFMFSYRSANAVADALAVKARTSASAVYEAEPPSFIFPFLSTDLPHVTEASAVI
ncbi:hypothetical protein BVC80_1719g69 [Macleaya cordata]|uniref:RNase H type-1 domain-containing protein n=1 Tax=Macleaya cordata TaxID=56857 RepID=A0A200Q2S9_MACCD|nr:hypothetical protein BVC80_1719g69 [Macleaya cordata]